MRTRLSTFTAATLAAFCVTAAHTANAEAPTALSGQVSSAKEGAMEGVVISAKRAGGTITVSVVTDEKGRYSFPAERLQPGRYTLGARAAGHDLDGPKAGDGTPGPAAPADIKLTPPHNLPPPLPHAA